MSYVLESRIKVGYPDNIEQCMIITLWKKRGGYSTRNFRRGRVRVAYQWQRHYCHHWRCLIKRKR